MKLCVVGNGPSAKSQGHVIDACEFVVRIKAWWENGAEDAGSQCDAIAHYGWGGGGNVLSRSTDEHWITQAVEQVQAHDDGWERLNYINRIANLKPIRWATKRMWDGANGYLNRHPSTGFMAVSMAMEIMEPTELVLYGFDGTTPERPNYDDARGPKDTKFAHDQLAEKRALALIGDGTWLGKPTNTKLIWPDMPVGVL